MSCVMEMDDPLNLATLPPDIIRRIIRLEPTSETDMRLISRSWNVLAKQYFAKLPFPLERVQLSMGIIYDSDSRIAQEESKDRLKMHAVFPNKYPARVGVGRWLRVLGSDDRGSIEVASEPWQIVNWNASRVSHAGFTSLMLLVTVLLIIGSFAAWPNVIPTIIASFLLVASLYSLSIFTQDYAQIKRNRALFVRFFNLFPRVKTLVLQNFEGHVLKEARKTIRGVNIDQLEVRGADLSAGMQEQIVKLCRDSKIGGVFIKTCVITTAASFRKFIDQVLEFSSLDLYEISSSNENRYFDMTREEWDMMTNHLSTQGVSMRMKTIHDDGFNGYGREIKAHFRWQKSGENESDELLPVQASRGLNYA